MKETREILVNWIGDLNAFKAEFPRVQVVPIPEMIDGSYMIIYECYIEEVEGETIVHDFDDEQIWLDDNGTLQMVGKWGKKGDNKKDKDGNKTFKVVKYKKLLRKIWDEDKQKFVKAPKDTRVNGVSGWQNRNIE